MTTILFFLMALASLPFSNGRWLSPLAGFLGPLALTLFIRRFPAKKGLGLGFLILLMTSLISWSSVNKVVSGPLLYTGAALMLLLALVPYAADRRFRSEKSPYFFSTLVMPLAWVSVDTVFSLLIADQGSIAYSQFENLPLLQLASVTGMSGVTFIIAWTASFASWWYENDFKFKISRFGIYVFVFVIAAVLEFGLYRMSVHPPAGDLIPVAAMTSNRDSKITHADLLTKTAEAAGTGARIILWSEVLGSELTGVKELAQDHGIFIFAAVGMRIRNQPLFDNKVVLFDPAGEERLTYRKANLAPGEPSVPGERKFQFKDTLQGRFGTAICADISYSHFMRAAGQNAADLVFVPAAEWPEVAKIQTAVGIFRAVENGFNLVKATSHGKSLVVDYTGRILAQTDNPSEETLIASVPNRGTVTLYSQGGWLFGFICLALFIAWLGRAYFKKSGGPDRG